MTTDEAVQKMRDVIRLRHLSLSTEDNYVSWLRRFARFVSERCDPLAKPEQKMEAFLTRLAQQEVSASTQNQAVDFSSSRATIRRVEIEKHRRRALWTPDRNQQINEQAGVRPMALPLFVRVTKSHLWIFASERQDAFMRVPEQRSGDNEAPNARPIRNKAVSRMEGHAPSVLQQEHAGLSQLRRKGDCGMSAVAFFQLLRGGYGASGRERELGSLSRQQRQLRTRKLSVGKRITAVVQSKGESRLEDWQ